ncbi:MAG: AMP-binding protein [Actinobacteria bacterium]|nr:AMP-binding protein [Actinomycetota bacterium]MSW37193.1 AMP-binding protein [Actinomycetota bacterium]
MCRMSGFTVAALIQGTALRSPNTVAIVAPDGSEQTYADLLTTGRRLGNALLATGLAPGDRIAAWMEDSLEYVQVYVACALAGLVVVPINARLTHHEATHLVSDSGARVLLFTGGLSGHVASLTSVVPDLALVSTVADPQAPTTLSELVASGSDDVQPAPSPDDLYMIGYTSGTTGLPKGAMLTQGSVAALARLNAQSYRLALGSICALTGSMSFVAVVPSHIISHFYVGGTVRILGSWDVASLIDTIERHRITFTYLPSPVLGEFAEKAAADPARLSSLLSVLHSASKASLEKLRAVADVIGGVLIEGLGMTENSGGLVTVTSPSDIRLEPGRPDRLASVGRAVQETLVEVLAPDGKPVPHDGVSVGEIVVSSPALLVGYWNRPEATADALRDGWYFTGDLGSLDAEGYLVISERRVDLIVSGGMNVYPSEVEEVIMRVPGVVSCAVVGLPHERWGQSVVAAVVVDPAVVVTEDQILQMCREYLASYKKPTRVQFLDSMPTTTSLKISRSRVRDSLAT